VTEFQEIRELRIIDACSWCWAQWYSRTSWMYRIKPKLKRITLWKEEKKGGLWD